MITFQVFSNCSTNPDTPLSLNLSHNSISRLVDANFDGLSGLTSLSLGHNRIESVTSAAFHHLAR